MIKNLQTVREPGEMDKSPSINNYLFPYDDAEKILDRKHRQVEEKRNWSSTGPLTYAACPTIGINPYRYGRKNHANLCELLEQENQLPERHYDEEGNERNLY